MLWAVATLTVATACGAGSYHVATITGRIDGKSQFGYRKNVVIVLRAHGHVVKQKALKGPTQHFSLRVAAGSYVIALADQGDQILGGPCNKKRVVVRPKRVARVDLMVPCAPTTY